MRQIKLTKGYYSIVDDEDYDFLSQWKWHSVNKGYARRYGLNKELIFIHNVLTNCPKHKRVDHINGNPCDNRKENLRIVTCSQNSMNKKGRKTGSSKFKGVCFAKKRNKWQASIRVKNKEKFLGYFKTEIEAAKAYDIAALEHYKQYAKINGV